MTHSLVEKNQQSEENKVSNRTETPCQHERRESVESLKHVWENETVLPHRGLHRRKSTININQSSFMLIVDCWLWVCGSCLLEQGSELLLCSPHLTLWLNHSPSGCVWTWNTTVLRPTDPELTQWGALRGLMYPTWVASTPPTELRESDPLRCLSDTVMAVCLSHLSVCSQGHSVTGEF